MCYLTRYGAVYLIGQPIFTSHSFELEHAVDIFVEVRGIVGNVLIFAFHCFVDHHRLRRVSKHLCHIEVERTLAISLYE